MPNIVTEVELPEGMCRVSVVVNSTVIKQPTTCMGLHRQVSQGHCATQCDTEQQAIEEGNIVDGCEGTLNEFGACDENAAPGR
jgi:hypothetical protein